MFLRKFFLRQNTFSFISQAENYSGIRECYEFVRQFSKDAPLKHLKDASEVKDHPFVDKLRIRVSAGDGGSGCYSFRKSKHSRHGYADGGNGGKGGDIILKACSRMRDLASIKQAITAQKGGHGSSKGKHGTRGADQIVSVPVGTVVWFLDGDFPEASGLPAGDCTSPEALLPPGLEMTAGSQLAQQQDEEEEDYDEDEFPEASGPDGQDFDSPGRFQPIRGVQVADMDRSDDQVRVGIGGMGGKGNASLASAKRTNHSHRDDLNDEGAQKTGQKGTHGNFLLELKLIADVGLVGAPNAGKSTLIRALTRAQPRIGSYAFTTVKPQLGTVDFGSHGCLLTLADIPGLVEGANQNRGLGLGFLRHVERTKCLVFVLDMAPREGDCSPWQKFENLLFELEAYKEGLVSSKRYLIVANKMDEEAASANLEILRRKVPEGVQVFPTCAVLGEGVDEVKEAMKDLVLGT